MIWQTLKEQHEMEGRLIGYREMTAQRDELVRAALATGLTKHRIFVLSGIARTTIDRALDDEHQGEIAS
jgi:hypothetical protein